MLFKQMHVQMDNDKRTALCSAIEQKTQCRHSPQPLLPSGVDSSRDLTAIRLAGKREQRRRTFSPSHSRGKSGTEELRQH